MVGSPRRESSLVVTIFGCSHSCIITSTGTFIFRCMVSSSNSLPVLRNGISGFIPASQISSWYTDRCLGWLVICWSAQQSILFAMLHQYTLPDARGSSWGKGFSTEQWMLWSHILLAITLHAHVALLCHFSLLWRKCRRHLDIMSCQYCHKRGYSLH